MVRDQLDLPLAEDASGRFLALIMAVMVYLAILALSGAMALSGMAARWERGLTGVLTVQIAHQAPPGAPTLSLRTEAALALLRQTPGIARAEPVNQETVNRLLDPWIGEALLGDLPLPALIDVHPDPAVLLDVPGLGRRLAEEAPGARLDNHAAWLADLRKLSGTAEAIAVLVVVLVGAAGIGTVTYTVRTGLALHQGVVELLHIIGATDAYVARQFQAHVQDLALRGGLVGFVLGGGSLIAARFAVGSTLGPLLPVLSLSFLQWALLAVVPLLATVLAVVTARWTVLRILSGLL